MKNYSVSIPDPYGGFKVFCDLCQNFPMRYVYGLIHHLRSKHPKHPEFICSQHCGFEGKFCDENFSSIDELIDHVKSHLKTHQKNNVQYKCRICGKGYNTSKNRLRHEREKHDPSYKRFVYHVQFSKFHV